MPTLKELLSQRHNSFNHAEAMEFIDKIEKAVEEMDEDCEYAIFDEDANAWECNKCGEVWYFTDGGPKENNMNFCPLCGRDLRKGDING